jgi:tetratricopeptide (TPR) repeat protein
MASLIPGYEYDIFISYRQKDNKGDKWVSKFVDALMTELEATFKEDISIYFDENPHDRLQETHNVDKSLESKLKCLIFIPILSQTYCDPNSYAWKNEFLTFLNMAENDHFGKDVKLKTGNVASRVLPVKIYDLEPEDVKMFERETESVLRGMDFVFKTATGVNRPLKVNEDHSQDNLSKTFYSDQINKMAHSIKEIILAMKTEPEKVAKEKEQPEESLKEITEDKRNYSSEKPVKAAKIKLVSAISVLAILIIAGIFAFPKMFKHNTIEKLRSSGERISVVVMPFHNMTSNPGWDVWQDGIQDILITSLSNSEELKVRQAESINSLIHGGGLANYASITPSLAGSISQKLDANVFVYGNIKQAGNILRLNAQLIDSETEEVYKSFQIEAPSVEKLIFNIVDSLAVMVRNFLVISELGKGLLSHDRDQVSTSSPEAYKSFIFGRNEFMKIDYPAARKYLYRAISIDSNFIHAINVLALTYGNQFLWDQAKKWSLKSYEKREQMPMKQKINTNRIHALYFETPIQEIQYLRQLLDIDDQDPITYYNLGTAYIKLRQYDKAIPEYEKALQIYKKWGVNPFWILNYTYLGTAYHKTGRFKKEKALYIKAQEDFPDNLSLIRNQSVYSLSVNDTAETDRLLEKARAYFKSTSATEATISAVRANVFVDAGLMDEAEEYFRTALSSEPENPVRLNDLANFLIDKDRNISEGMDYVEKALHSDPVNYNYLHTKGWGLYKQSKYLEAADLLQKSWDLRRKKAIYDHDAYYHLEAAKKAVTDQKKN